MSDAPVDALKRIFKTAPFIASLGLELESAAQGVCETSLTIRPDHLQQNGVVHAGVVATMADHTAGGASSTVLEPGCYPLTVEFKINLLRAATGDRLRCASRVLKPGRQFVIAESEVFGGAGAGEKLIAKALVTLAVQRRAETG